MTNYYNNVYINDKYSLLFSTKYNPIVKDYVNKYIDDYYLDEKTIELAESRAQIITINELIKKYKNISLLISGDLQNQILSSSLSASNFDKSFLGIYAACASFTEGLIIASHFVNNNSIIVTVSSHNLVSEKQFRFPVEYGALRKRVNTCTASASISTLISNKKSSIKVESSTIGMVCKSDLKDTNDLGSAMALSTSKVLIKHLKDTKRDASYYDLILTGDLGEYGKEIVKKYYKKVTNKKINNLIDSGSIFYTEDNVYAGASGPTCLPLVLFDYILKLKKYKRILIIGSGSLHSVLSSNLKLPIPSVSHAVSLEVSY